MPAYEFQCSGRVTEWMACVELGSAREEYYIQFQVWRPNRTIVSDGCYSLVGLNQPMTDDDDDEEPFLSPIDDGPLRRCVVLSVAEDEQIEVQSGDVVGYYVDSLKEENDGIQWIDDSDVTVYHYESPLPRADIKSHYAVSGVDPTSCGFGIPEAEAASYSLASSPTSAPIISLSITCKRIVLSYAIIIHYCDAAMTSAQPKPLPLSHSPALTKYYAPSTTQSAVSTYTPSEPDSSNTAGTITAVVLTIIILSLGKNNPSPYSTAPSSLSVFAVGSVLIVFIIKRKTKPHTRKLPTTATVTSVIKQMRRIPQSPVMSRHPPTQPMLLLLVYLPMATQSQHQESLVLRTLLPATVTVTTVILNFKQMRLITQSAVMSRHPPTQPIYMLVLAYIPMPTQNQSLVLRTLLPTTVKWKLKQMKLITQSPVMSKHPPTQPMLLLLVYLPMTTQSQHQESLILRTWLLQLMWHMRELTPPHLTIQHICPQRAVVKRLWNMPIYTTETTPLMYINSPYSRGVSNFVSKRFRMRMRGFTAAADCLHDSKQNARIYK